MPRTRSTRGRLQALLAFLIFAVAAVDIPVAGVAPTPAAAADAEEAAKKRAIKGLGKRLRKLARSPHVMKKLKEVNEVLDALEVHAGTEAALEALGGAAIADEKIRERIFTFVEEHHHKSMTKPLIALLQHKDHRRDVSLKTKLVHALAVVADPAAIEPLSKLIAFATDADLVAEVCAAFGAFTTAKIEQRKIAVKAMIDLYEVTYNLMKSIRPEDKILSKIASKRWRKHAPAMRTAMQGMTGKQWTRAHEWRRWWNDCKKAKDWAKCKSKLDKRRTG